MTFPAPWMITGRATTLPADPGWHALIVAHDTDGKPVESSPGQTSIVAVDVTAWAVGVAIRTVQEEGSLRVACGLPPKFPAKTEQMVNLLPLDSAGDRLDHCKGYLGLSCPGETPAAALDRLAPKAIDAAATAHIATGEP